MIDDKAINAIRDLAYAANRVQQVTAPTGDQPLYIIKPNGERDRVDPIPPPLRTELLTVEDFNAFVSQEMGKGQPDTEEGLPRNPLDAEAYVNDERLLFLWQRQNPREFARCDLVKSKPWAWLENSGGQPMEQTKLVHSLRITFRGCCPPALLTTVRKLKFNVGTEQEGDIQHGRESLGKSIEAKITGDVPEECKLTLNVFENYDLKVEVACALEVNPQKGTIAITPYPGELRQAMESTLAQIKDDFNKVGDAMPPIYQGGPIIDGYQIPL